VIFKGDTFELDGRRFALLGAHGDGELQEAIFIDKYGKKVFPQTMPMAWLQEAAKPLDEKHNCRTLVAAREGASEASKRRADVRWHLIKGIVDAPELYQEGARWELVQAHAREMKCSANTILTALRLWWQGGQTRDALLGYRMRPKSPEEQAEEHNKKKLELTKPCMRGRPATKPGSVNFRATGLDHENYKNVIDTYYMKDARLGVRHAYAELLARHYTYVDGNGARFLKSPGEYPSLRQFGCYLKKHYSTEFMLRSRKGAKAFAREDRQVFGTVEDTCRRPGQIYELDSTIADATIVSSEGRKDIIGRPTVFIIIDRKSRLIVGWYIGLEKPCWDAVLEAIFSVAEDKRALCRRLKIDYDPNDWVAQGILCELLLVDRGEVRDRRANSLVSLNTTISHLPSCRPDWKPLVEGSFKLTHAAIKDAPGYNPASNAVKRRSVDYSTQAALTLEEFEAIVVRWFIAHNRTVRKNHEFSRDQYRDRVEPSPLNLFSHGIRTQSGMMRRFSEEELKLALLPRAEATIDERGIWVNKMCYQPEGGEHPEWFVEGRRGVGAVKISYDRRRVDRIYVHDDRSPGGFFFAKLARHSVRYQGLSLAEAQWMQRGEEELLANADHSRNEQFTRFKDYARPITESAMREMKAATKGASKASRRAITPQAREAELNRERDRRTAEGGTAGSPCGTVAPSSPSVSNVTPLPISGAARQARALLLNAESL
jgi:hypothetical protein